MKKLSSRPARALLLGLSAMILVSCMPIARWTPADGGPPPPRGPISLLPVESSEEVAEGAEAALPTPTATPSPTPTEPPVAVEPISDAQAQECLAAGKVLYGLALQNANVRQNAETEACRIGRIPKGALVQITGSVAAGDTALATPTSETLAFLFPDETATPVATPTNAPTPTPQPVAVAAPVDTGPRIGFVEDVQPLFMRVCNSCHSGIVKMNGLQVTEYEPLMTGTLTGTVVIPGNADGSRLWEMLSTRRMPLVGTLGDGELAMVRDWIDSGAPERRPAPPMQVAEATPAPVAAAPTRLPAQAVIRPVTSAAEENARAWLSVAQEDFNPVSDLCENPAAEPLAVVSSELILPVSCGEAPNPAGLDLLRSALSLPGGAPVAAAPASVPADAAALTATESVSATIALTATAVDPVTAAAAGVITDSAALPAAAVRPAFAPVPAAGTGITTAALGVAPPADADGWLTPRGGLCIERKLPNNSRGVTAITFAPDGRIFLALDSSLTSNVDPLILYDAFHPSRSVAVVDSNTFVGLTEIMVESTRITGMDWENGMLFISRAGEVGMIPDGGAYEPLAGGFAVNSQLFHANNGLVVSGGWVYVSAGGVMDGWSDGPIVGMGEAGAQQIVSGGNPYAARIVRAPLDALLSARSISAFSTAARGVRNPYGITADGAGRIWFTDNGATNLPEDVSAGDEVNVLNPGTIGGGEENSPYYGFPLALTGAAPWYTPPAVTLPNTAAPTGITWALGTIYYAQYGKDPGLYRLGMAGDGTLISERVLLGWPILAVATAPDGALWIGLGDGGLFRITGGCAN